MSGLGYVGGPLRGARVLVPRGGEWGDEAADLVRAFGGSPVVAPLIEFAPPRDPAPLEAACRALEAGDYDWIVVTSPRTVEALPRWPSSAELDHSWPSSAERVSRPPEDGRSIRGSAATHAAGDAERDHSWPSSAERVSRPPEDGRSIRGSAATHAADGPERRPRVAAVGEATAAALAAHGIATDWLPESEASARAMVREWPDMPRARILWPRSSEARRTIAEGLAERGHVVDDPIAYRTVEAVLAPEAVAELREGAIDWVLVTSGTVARSLAAQAGAAIPAGIATIGPIATADARRAGFDVAIEAAAPSVLAILEAMAAGREPESGPGGDDPFAGLFQLPDLP